METVGEPQQPQIATLPKRERSWGLTVIVVAHNQTTSFRRCLNAAQQRKLEDEGKRLHRDAIGRTDISPPNEEATDIFALRVTWRPRKDAAAGCYTASAAANAISAERETEGPAAAVRRSIVKAMRALK